MTAVKAGPAAWSITCASEVCAMEFTVYHLLIIVAFVGIVVWAFGRKRKARFEKDAKIPFEGDKR
jgi:cytochrome c oxidase cbb3-type subunit 4